jgi:antitoxin PrlF
VVSATMTSKGQLTVPKCIRDQLGLAPGDKVEFVPGEDGQVTLRKRRTLSLADVLGALPNNGVTRTLEGLKEDLGQAIADAVTRR